MRAYVRVCVCVCVCDISAWLSVYSTVLCLCMLSFCSRPVYLYLSWSVYVCVSVFLYLQYYMNAPLQIVKQSGHWNSFKQFSDFLLKEESVPPDALSRKSKPFFKT